MKSFFAIERIIHFLHYVHTCICSDNLRRWMIVLLPIKVNNDITTVQKQINDSIAFSLRSFDEIILKLKIKLFIGDQFRYNYLS